MLVTASRNSSDFGSRAKPGAPSYVRPVATPAVVTALVPVAFRNLVMLNFAIGPSAQGPVAPRSQAPVSNRADRRYEQRLGSQRPPAKAPQWMALVVAPEIESV